MLREAALRLQLPERRHLQHLHGYRIYHQGNSPSQMDSFLKAYGDFNNDLRADYVSVDSNGNTLIFLYNTASGNYEQTANSLPPIENCIPANYYLCKPYCIQTMPMTMAALISQCGAPIQQEIACTSCSKMTAPSKPQSALSTSPPPPSQFFSSSICQQAADTSRPTVCCYTIKIQESTSGRSTTSAMATSNSFFRQCQPTLGIHVYWWGLFGSCVLESTLEYFHRPY